MGKSGWLVLIPGAAIAAAAWLHLYPLASAPAGAIAWAAAGLSAVFVVWGLLGKDAAVA
jgi:hypothetical protein